MSWHQVFARFLGDMVEAFFITRYMISTLVMVIVLLYSIFTFIQWLPVYSTLIHQWGISEVAFFGVCYLSTALITSLLWIIWTRISKDDIYDSELWRWIDRQNDRSGLRVFDLFTFSMYIVGYLLSTILLTDYRLMHGVNFLTVVLCLPLIVGFLPQGRPPRYIVGRKESLRSIAKEMSRPSSSNEHIERIADILRRYNQDNLVKDTENETELPEGMIIDIPLRLPRN